MTSEKSLQRSEKIKSLNEDDLDELEKEIYRRDLFRFIKGGLKYRELTRTTHDQICKALSDDSRRKLICVPRGTFKSTICSVAYPLWLLNQNPNLRICIDSEVYSNSKNFLREIRGHLESESLTKLYGNYRGELWNEGELTIAQRTKIVKEPSLTAMGVETTRVGQHYDVIICDDMNSDNNSMTEEGRQKVINHYRLLTSILEPDGVIVVVATRYAANDLVGWIMENEIDGDPNNQDYSQGLLRLSRDTPNNEPG